MRKGLVIVGFFAVTFSPGTFAMTDAESVSRGKLLYENHCGVCHTSKVHQREHRAAKNLDGIHFQVNRWQTHLKLNWTEREISDVVNFVNDQFYHYED